MLCSSSVHSKGTFSACCRKRKLRRLVQFSVWNSPLPVLHGHQPHHRHQHQGGHQFHLRWAKQRPDEASGCLVNLCFYDSTCSKWSLQGSNRVFSRFTQVSCCVLSTVAVVFSVSFINHSVTLMYSVSLFCVFSQTLSTRERFRRVQFRIHSSLISMSCFQL